MINEGGAIAQPRYNPSASSCCPSLHQIARAYPIQTMLAAFGAGALLGLLLSQD